MLRSDSKCKKKYAKFVNMNMKKAIFLFHKEYVHVHVIEVHFLMIKHAGLHLHVCKGESEIIDG